MVSYYNPLAMYHGKGAIGSGGGGHGQYHGAAAAWYGVGGYAAAQGAPPPQQFLGGEEQQPAAAAAWHHAHHFQPSPEWPAASPDFAAPHEPHAPHAPLAPHAPHAPPPHFLKGEPLDRDALLASPSACTASNGSDLSSPGAASPAGRPPLPRSPYEWMKKPSYQSQPNPGKTRTKDKYRVVYTDHQRLELEKEFHYNRYITIRRKAELAANLCLSERQVKIWFQNRRAKERKQVKKNEEMSHKTKIVDTFVHQQLHSQHVATLHHHGQHLAMNGILHHDMHHQANQSLGRISAVSTLQLL